MRRVLSILGLLALLALAFAARCWNLRDVFVQGRIYFVDADCYSRMTRARMVAGGEALVIRHHDFENFPAGITPHTTAPLDWLIVAGKGALDLGFAIFDRGKTSVLRAQTLDLAGALISPLLGAATCAWLAWSLGRVKGVPRAGIPHGGPQCFNVVDQQTEFAFQQVDREEVGSTKNAIAAIVGHMVIVAGSCIRRKATGGRRCAIPPYRADSTDGP